jgi:SSS family solute:Na+ symporter
MHTGLATVDYVVIGAYLVFALVVGVVLTRKASESSESYFLGGRTLPWWLVGISMVATSFASDTPIVVTEMIRQHGLQRIWWFFGACIGLSLGVFLFSRLWRRAEITTDAELYELRYSGRAAAVLRAFKGGWSGIVANLITMSWVINAMSGIITTLIDVNRWAAIAVCVLVALTYAMMSGFYGVVVTDFVQFFIAVGSMLYLAAVAWVRIGGFEEIQARVAAAPGYGEQTLSLFPDISHPGMDLLALFIFVVVLWWNDSGGYHMQRMSSCRDERHSILATLFLAVFQTSRAWLWIGVALVSIALFPDLSHTALGDTQAYPMVMDAYLGPGIKGLLVTGFLAAFMSTIDTHLNWGASYVMTDIYRRFMVREATERHYMWVTKVVVVLLMAGASLVAPLFSSVTEAWELLALTQAGVGLIAVLRWFWWRVSAYTELAVLLVSGALAIANLVLQHAWPGLTLFGLPWGQMPFEVKVALFIAISVPASIVVTYLTPPVERGRLEAFYRRVRPGGFWGVLPDEVRALPGQAFSAGSVADFFGGLMLMFGVSLGIGYSLLQRQGLALVCFGVAGLGALWTRRWFKREVAAMRRA